MFFEMFFGIGIGVAIILAILAIVGFLTVAFTVGSIWFSRISFSLLVGLVACNQVDIVSNGLLNFVIWAAIGGVITYGLSTLPRCAGAISFFCTAFVTTIVVSLVGGAAFSIYNTIAKTGADLSITMGFEILIKAIAAVFGVMAYVKQNEKGSLVNPSGFVLVNIDRLIASVIVGFTFVFLYSPWNGNWHTSETLEWIILIGGTAVTFVADMFLNKE